MDEKKRNPPVCAESTLEYQRADEILFRLWIDITRGPVNLDPFVAILKATEFDPPADVIEKLSELAHLNAVGFVQSLGKVRIGRVLYLVPFSETLG